MALQRVRFVNGSRGPENARAPSLLRAVSCGRVLVQFLSLALWLWNGSRLLSLHPALFPFLLITFSLLTLASSPGLAVFELIHVFTWLLLALTILPSVVALHPFGSVALFRRPARRPPLSLYVLKVLNRQPEQASVGCRLWDSRKPWRSPCPQELVI